LMSAALFFAPARAKPLLPKATMNRLLCAISGAASAVSAVSAVCIALLCAVAPASAQAPAASPALAAALASPHRSAANVARDVWRHPLQTLQFFDVQPGMRVIEISPGGGWYTEILVPYLRDQGQLTLAADDPESVHAYYRRSADRLAKKLQALPAVYDRVRVVPFEVPGKVDLGGTTTAGTADRVLTFRNVHNWVGEGEAAVVAVFKAAFTALKPGGVLGVVDHRLPASREQDAKASSGYVHVAYVVRLAQQAGFVLAGASEVNANPKDTADHAKGVWALPPSYANKDTDRARYEAIGESDRFTLKFVRP
jgi:predicted methyltransferase